MRYAELTPYEKRLYLQIWCEETADNRDVPELEHNRTLRLDRIQAVVPISGQWHGQLDQILVEVHFLNGLVHAYEPHLEDVEDQKIDDIRRVVRRIHNSFWFFSRSQALWSRLHCDRPRGSTPALLPKMS